MIDPSYFCPGCNTCLGCTCPPPGWEDERYEEAYERGYEACLSDGYDAHPLACWPCDEADAAMASDWLRLVTGAAVRGVDGRRFYGSNWFNVPGAYRRRGPYGHDPLRGEPCPEGYLAGWDDCGAGLPPAVSDPERHAVCAAALDDYEPVPDLDDALAGPVVPLEPADVDDALPF